MRQVIHYFDFHLCEFFYAKHAIKIIKRQTNAASSVFNIKLFVGI